ncbi:MAG: cob(I)yrinic acid a,c-diamide adenosyltransferase [Desulfobulbus propionicus]|nr:MAG: cob(I)yrinic acid a,c-diamide adenosyltransferase [Desulfobulbus propionicus]
MHPKKQDNTGQEPRGLLMVFTGHGKGKTTSALGMAMRAAGHGMKVLFLQFIKGSWKYGEMEAIARFPETIELLVEGRGVTWKSDDLDKDKAAAINAWSKAKEAISSGKYDMIVLDEFTYLLLYNMIDRSEALQTLAAKPSALHLVITGRNAPPELIEQADLVTEMQAVKHPYKEGIKAQKGVEF